jgi:hypothetical protein
MPCNIFFIILKELVMKVEVVKVILVMASLLITPCLQAVVIDSNQTIDSGDYNQVDVINSAVLDVTGGDIFSLFSDNNTVVNMYDGVMRSATLSDESTLNLRGGTIIGVYPNQATVNIYYFSLNEVQVGQVQDGNATVTISGVWENGNTFLIDFKRVSPDIPNINLIPVPEPTSILLLGSIVFLRLRKSRHVSG